MENRGEFLFLDDAGIQELKCELLTEVMEGQQTVALFISPSCGPCAEYLADVANIGDIPGTNFAVIDIDACQSLVETYHIDITPTIIIQSATGDQTRLPITGELSQDIQALKNLLGDSAQWQTQ